MNVLKRSIPPLLVALLALVVPLSLTGCGSGSNDPSPAGQTLSDADRIKAQGSCPVTGERLGSMGRPVKVTVKDEPVFLCCDACEEEALANPDKTLAKVKELKGR